MYPTPDPATHEANRLAEGARHILQPGIGALIFIRGSTALDSSTMINPGAYLKTRLPPVLPPRVQEYMRR